MTKTSPIPVGKYAKLSNGYTIHYHEQGSPVPGMPSILMLHGSGPGASGYSNFKGNFPFFADHGHHVIIPDCIGYGLSSKPDDYIYSVDNQVAILRELMAIVGTVKLTIIGNSLGGWFALHHAIHFPDEVESLILMAPGGLEPPEKFVGEMEGLKELFRIPAERDFSIAAMRNLFGLFMFDAGNVPDSVLAERLAIAQEQPMQIYSTLSGTIVTPRLNEISVPVLAFWGYHDKFIPYRHSSYLLDNLPNLKMVTSNQAGHWFMIEHQDVFNQTCLELLS